VAASNTAAPSAARTATTAALRRLGHLLQAAGDRLARPAAVTDPVVEAPEPAAPVSRVGYGERWSPPDAAQAMRIIYNTESEASFEEGGRLDAERLSDYLTPEATALDFGCGMGRVARYVAEHCAEVWAVDAAEGMLKLAAERLADRPNVRFAQCHETAIPDVPDRSVDLVYSILVLQHLEREDAFKVLRELYRVLRPGATAYLTFPNLLSDEYLGAFLSYVEAGEVTNPIRARYYTPQEVERLLPVAGFEVVELRPDTNIVAVGRRPVSP
jgi:SAM-dependent methyltransferase